MMMMPDPPPVAGTKRPLEPSTTSNAPHGPAKRQRVHHVLQHVQQIPNHIEPAPQAPIYAQGQLMKSISAALVMAGFDSVRPTALESFRAHVEEYMLHFLSHARTSMLNNRRTTPTALDFAKALAEMPNTQNASMLIPQVVLDVPDDISTPTISLQRPEPLEPLDFSRLLKPLMEQHPPAWVPSHFPKLPPQHSWKETAVFPERERDARKMREKATEEGVLAEQALRKLAAAAKTSAMNAEKNRNNVLRGEGKLRGPAKAGTRNGARAHEDTFADMLKELGGGDEAMDLASDEAEARTGMDLGMPEGVVVNHDMSHWRRPGQRGGMRA
ncbi:Putative bromodomain associated domain, histone-fold, transcription factor TFIID, subunit 8 [Septoria linicola]|uniref:Transcription initiation factor TFIID subunit 8 n=1 Tax=Septoria linicola TaxID=215465 RepID=A0A9Q9AHQ9_9PEZI|nr:putative bromodomain associated domain, histone-fold, transcription factor TFIID, subunit 8 [Septoria linicola]USW49295.1 Putative bromodomain associated domain, histone-fold, transcription factor TFIID, subunit 8 [Septoria linicola]